MEINEKHTEFILHLHRLKGDFLPSSMHLVLYNCDYTTFNYSERSLLYYKEAIRLNINVFKPHIRAFKKARSGIYCNIITNESMCCFVVEEIYKSIKSKKDSLNCKNMRRSFNYKRPSLFKYLISRQNVCCFCGSDKDLTIDHILPLSRNGSNDIKNLQILCRSCNSRKSNKIITN